MRVAEKDKEREAEETEKARQSQLQQFWEETWSTPANSSSASERASPEPISPANNVVPAITTDSSSPLWDLETPDQTMFSEDREWTPPTSPTSANGPEENHSLSPKRKSRKAPHTGNPRRTCTIVSPPAFVLPI